MTPSRSGRMLAGAILAVTALALALGAAGSPPSQMATVIRNFGLPGGPGDGDLNGDGIVNADDIVIAAQSGDIAIDTIEPKIVGVGTKMRLRGHGLGSAATAAVVFGDSAVATDVLSHDDQEIVFTVPADAPAGFTTVRVTPRGGAGGPAGGPGGGAVGATAVAPAPIAVVSTYLSTPRLTGLLENGGLQFVPNRLIVGLNDFEGFDTAISIATTINAKLVGFIPPGNSYILDLNTLPTAWEQLVTVMRQVLADPRVDDVCGDLVLEHKAGVAFNQTDFMWRYGISNATNLNAREDCWNMDRIQAPAAWNLIKRYGPTAVTVPHIAVLDTGIDVNAGSRHAEFNGVSVKRVTPQNAITVTIAGSPAILPTGIMEANYTAGDASGHGTCVCSIIAARNGEGMPGTGGPAQPPLDRGVNGICINEKFNSIAVLQVHRGGANWPAEPGEGGRDNFTLTDFLAVINYAALTDCQFMNASWGQPRPIDPVGPNPPQGSAADQVRVGLRKLAKQLTQWKDKVLLCVAAGNEALDPNSWHGGEVTPYEDFNFNKQLDAGEDLDNNGVLSNGNYIGASLGSLPNVITVGAIIGSGRRDPASITGSNILMYRDDARWARAFGPNSAANPYANASNFGSRKTPNVGQPQDPTDVVVQLAAPGGDEILTAAAGGFRQFRIGTQWFVRFGGTSAATPTVTGSAALLVTAADSVLTPTQVKQRLINSSYPIMTSNTGGADLKWNTLKVGAAVRQMLLDDGRITDDGEWTGTSRIWFYRNEDVQAHTIEIWAKEIRQNSVTGRSQIFRETFVKKITYNHGDPLAFGANEEGTGIGYLESGKIYLWSLRGFFTYDIFNPPTGGVMRSAITRLPFTRDGLPLIEWALYDANCDRKWDGFRLNYGNTNYIRSHNIPAGEKEEWGIDFAIRRSGRFVYHRSAVTKYDLAPDEPCLAVDFQASAGADQDAFPLGAPIVLSPPPPSPLNQFQNPMWSTDGRLFTGRTAANRVTARRIDSEGVVHWQDSDFDADGVPIWSPDGSEVLIDRNLWRRNHTDKLANFLDPDSNFAWSW